MLAKKIRKTKDGLGFIYELSSPITHNDISYDFVIAKSYSPIAVAQGFFYMPAYSCLLGAIKTDKGFRQGETIWKLEHNKLSQSSILLQRNIKVANKVEWQKK